MTGKAFLDTNIFVYDIDSVADRAKRRVARDLIHDSLRHRRNVVSYQVIQEFLNIATGKFSTAITIPDAQQYVNTVFRPLLAVHSSLQLFHEALDISARYRLSWYDSLVVAAAAEAKCNILYSEDLGHGMKINGVRIENPFRTH